MTRFSLSYFTPQILLASQFYFASQLMYSVGERDVGIHTLC